MTKPVALVLVDDHRVVTRGLRMFLESYADLRVVGVAASGEELLEKIGEWQPDIVILDVMMPGGMDGIDTARRVREAHPQVKIIALTAATDEARMAGMLRAGASGYVRKDSDPEVLRDAIRAVARGKTFVCGVDAPAESELSPREQEVLREVGCGRTNREIAERLCISEETVKTHVGRLLGKLNLQHRTQLALHAVRSGMV